MHCKPVIHVLLLFPIGIGAFAQTQAIQDSAQKNIVIRCYATGFTATQTGSWKETPLFNTTVILLRDSIFQQEFRANDAGYITIPSIETNDQFYALDMYYHRSEIYLGTKYITGDTLEIPIPVKNHIQRSH